MENFITYPIMQVRPWGLLVYEKKEYYTNRQFDRDKTNTKNQSPNHKLYTGTLSPFAQKRLRRAIQLLIAISKPKEVEHFKSGKKFKFNVNFITLTLSKVGHGLSDKEIKKSLLDNWLKRMRRKFGLKSYVWRAERQKNGNIHFHLVTDTYIRYDYIRNEWNALQYKLGLLDDYMKKKGHMNANSTDVHSVQKIKNLAAYLLKYMTKTKAQDEIIEGKLWDCSTNLKTKKNCELLLEGEVLEVWNKAVNDERSKVKFDSLFTLIFLDKLAFATLVTGSVLGMWLAYLDGIANFVDVPAG